MRSLWCGSGRDGLPRHKSCIIQVHCYVHNLEISSGVDNVFCFVSRETSRVEVQKKAKAASHVGIIWRQTENEVRWSAKMAAGS